jgi:hypothetical protein
VTRAGCGVLRKATIHPEKESNGVVSVRCLKMTWPQRMPIAAHGVNASPFYTLQRQTVLDVKIRRDVQIVIVVNEAIAHHRSEILPRKWMVEPRGFEPLTS